MERRRRLVLFSAAMILVAALAVKGHSPAREDWKVAFFPSPPSELTVRLKGTESAGVYTLHRGATLNDVILLTGPASAAGLSGKQPMDMRLHNGDVVEITADSRQHVVLKVDRMKAGEAMLLGIRLDPDRMDIADWECLPGIGPRLAEKIVTYRQDNGDFHTIEAVREVPGLGPKKFTVIRKYFN